MRAGPVQMTVCLGLAEGGRFELPRGCPLAVFKTGVSLRHARLCMFALARDK
jgi:hypothetical protein